MIEAIAIDDELPALSIIENFCARLDFINLQKTFNQPTEALKYLKKFPVDLLFLDVNMPSLNGIDLYKSVQQETMVIFTTAYSEFAVEGFNLNAVDYLLKPFTFKRFLQASEKAQDYYAYQLQKQKTEAQYLFIRADYSLVKIDIKNILYIEGYDDYLKIHIEDQRPVITRMTIKNILEKLPENNFIRIHRSYVIPLDKVTSLRNKMVSVGEIKLPLGNSFEENFLKRFNK
ncbi:DNA-binding response regulator [Terrimonas sp.]|uniref:LytR/AlgR family response regulator transcription factor n=1 Tax=Terrimonas sp. TaxID=1914338 RepID=UPI000D51E490|nr:LytTR family DNA-binding domain-containing protein [Terrimonas sp.]PVD51699.1 DNA-binding response regulator [Terrimonas sp.]